MKKAIPAFLLATFSALTVVSDVAAKRAPPPPYSLRAAAADAVVIGKVTAVAEKEEKADLIPGDKRQMKIATVKVDSALLGKPGASVKVGFFVPAAGKVVGKKRKPPLIPSLKLDQEVCLFLVKHPTKKDVYFLSAYYSVVDKATFGKAGTETVKKAVRLMAEPMKGLKSTDAKDRLLTAILLVHRYNSPVLGNRKSEAVPTAESKLILTTLAEADWDTDIGDERDVNAPTAFYRLGLTVLDGWEPPTSFKDFPAVAKQWLKHNAGKYKMTRYFRDNTPPSEEPPP